MGTNGTPQVHPTGQPDWNNLEVLHKNTPPPRSYFHNYTSEADALTYDSNKSATHSLSGTWKFQHSSSPFEAPAGFESPSFDTSSWNDITVPGMWQLQGFGKGPQYTNVKYPIPVDPPNVPFTENETGSYMKIFNVQPEFKGSQIRLRFEGVDSSFHVWVNGKEVGYSQGSRNPDEFDITELVDQDGENTLAVQLLGTEKQILSTALANSAGRTEFSVPVKAPMKWTAETPNLYNLVVSLNSEQFIARRIGFRQVERKDGLIKVNGKRIVFRGVNRHEHHPRFGRAVPIEFLKQDLLTMKRHNINAIRTSHQPNDPRLYDLADEMGFWVMDEADLECHGFESIADASLSIEERKLPFRERQLLTRANAAKWTTDNPDWTHAYVDRAQHLAKRDQLHPSVIVWSMGNEAFFGRNFKAMYEWVKDFDDSRPIHYEADIHAETMDMFSRMYPTIDEIIAFGKDESKQKPLVLCEFVHAMGNGPGNIKEYIDAFYKYPKLGGGFAWEWANHGLLTKNEQTGEEFYGYGGDFGEVLHDSTFVMDGLLNSDHTPNRGLTEYKKAIEPVQFLEANQREAKFVNRYDFVTLDHLTCYLSTTSESHNSKPEEYPIPPGIAPGQTFEVELTTAPRSQGEVLLDVSFRTRHATPWLEAGFEIANAQIPLRPSVDLQRRKATSYEEAHLTVKKTSVNTLEMQSRTNKWAFNTLHGTLTSWVKESVVTISKAPEINFFRAPTDNDIPQDGWDWKDKLLHLAEVSTRKVEYVIKDTEVVITVHQRVAPPVFSWSVDCITTYNFEANELVIHMKGTPRGDNLPRTLPRVGLVMELPKGWQTVQWFGRGPRESYRDSKFSQKIGTYTVSSIDDLWVDYEVPQESSNRTDARWLQLQNGATELLVQFPEIEGSARGTFDWQATHYRMQDVAEANHPYELRRKRIDEVVLRLDWEHHGLGSGSCGPRTLDQYSLLTKDFEFEVLLQ